MERRNKLHQNQRLHQSPRSSQSLSSVDAVSRCCRCSAHILFSTLDNTSGCLNSVNPARCFVHDFSNGSNFYQTRHDLDQEYHNFHASRSTPCSAPPPDPLQSLIQWPFLLEFLHTSVPLEPDPLLRLPFTKASTSLPTDKMSLLQVNQAPRVCSPLSSRTPQRFLLLQQFLLPT